jgi:hypothetical protein
MKPELHILSGSQEDKILNLYPYLPPEQQAEMRREHPEYMGFFQLLLPAVPAIASGVGELIKSFGSAEAEKVAAATEAEKLKLLQLQLNMQDIQQQREAQEKQLLIIGGLALSAVVLIVITKKKSKKRR